MVSRNPALAEVPIAEWFARQAERTEDRKRALAIYRVGRSGKAKNAPAGRGNIALWIEALGTTEPGSPGETELLSELEKIKANPDQASRFHERVVSSKNNSERWRNGRERYLNWHRGA